MPEIGPVCGGGGVDWRMGPDRPPLPFAHWLPSRSSAIIVAVGFNPRTTDADTDADTDHLCPPRRRGIMAVEKAWGSYVPWIPRRKAIVNKIMQGVVHGRTIELSENPGVTDRQQVEIVLTAVPSQRSWGEGIRRSAGAAVDVPGFDEAFRQIEQERKAATFRETGA